MSVGIGGSGSAPALQNNNFFLDLPNEVLELVLRYISPGEGVQLMCTQKALHGRLIRMLLANQVGYFTCLCDRISSYFSFTPQEYRDDLAKKEEAMQEKWQEVLKEDVKPEALKKLEEASQDLGKGIYSEGGQWFKHYFGIFFTRKYQGTSFFYPFQEKIPEALRELGMGLVRINKAQERVIEWADQEVGNEQKRGVYIEIALSLGKGIEGRRAAYLIDTITNEREREIAKNIWIEDVKPDDPFLKTEEFLAWISPLPLIKHLVRTGEGTNQVLTLFDKTIREGNKSVKKEVLFWFFDYWCKHKDKLDRSCHGELYSKFMALTETLPVRERNVGVLEVLKGMISDLFLFNFMDVRQFSLDYALSCVSYLFHQINQGRMRPLHIMEVREHIIHQQEEHYRFNERIGLITPYALSGQSLIVFFYVAMERVQEEREASSILDSALKQIEQGGGITKAHFFERILALQFRDPFNIRQRIIDLQGERQ